MGCLKLIISLAGYTYCAIAALSLLGRLPDSTTSRFYPTSYASETIIPGLTDLPATIHWLVSRQTQYTDGDQVDNEDVYEYNDPILGDYLTNPVDKNFVGFNGRCNKRVDTCYSFWVGASLNVSPSVFSRNLIRLTSLCSDPRTPQCSKHRCDSKIPIHTNPASHWRFWEAS